MSFRDFFLKLTPKSVDKERLMHKNHLGFMLEKKELFTAAIRATDKKITVQLLAGIALSPSVKPLDILKEHLPEEFVNKAVSAASFETMKTLARPLELQIVKAKEIDSIIKFQIEPMLPYPIGEAILDKIRIAKKKKSTEFLVFAAQKQDLQASLNDFSQYGIDPEIISPKALALLQFVAVFFRKKGPRLVIDISSSETTCLLIDGATPLAIRSLPMGLESEDMQAENHVQTYSQELSRIFLSFQNLVEDFKKTPIIFTGPAERDPLIQSLLGKLLGHKTDRLDSLPEGIKLDDGISLEECAIYAVPIGLSLLKSPFQKGDFLINFRKEEFSYTNKWRHWKKDLLFYYASTFLLACTFYFIGEKSLRNERVTLQEKYSELIALYEKTPDDIEIAFIKQARPETGLENKTLIAELSASDIQSRVAFIESSLKPPKDEIALHPNVPRVSDLLAWLSSHPKIKLDGDTIKLENLSYMMVQRPDKEHPKTHYQVRVDMDLSSSSPLAARELQEALKAPNPFIDSKQEVSWSVQKGRYHATFFLKDRTEYP